MEETQIAIACKGLKSAAEPLGGVMANNTEVSQALNSALHCLQQLYEQADDANESFNAAEQIKSLQDAQKTTRQLYSDVRVLADEQVISKVHFEQLEQAIRMVDQAIDSMSDPEFS